MKQRQIPIGPYLSSFTEILHGLQGHTHIPGQEDLDPIDLKYLEALTSYHQQEKVNNRMALPHLQKGQKILYITTQGDWLSGSH